MRRCRGHRPNNHQEEEASDLSGHFAPSVLLICTHNSRTVKALLTGVETFRALWTIRIARKQFVAQKGIEEERQGADWAHRKCVSWAHPEMTYRGHIRPWGRTALRLRPEPLKGLGLAVSIPCASAGPS